MTAQDFVNRAETIQQAIKGGADEYDIAKLLNQLYHEGVFEGLAAMKEPSK